MIICLMQLVLLASACVFAKTDVPVFLLTGQSNMSGYASANDLTAEQKQSVDNVKIYSDMTWEGDDAKERKWLTLGTGFGSGAGKIGPELSFGRGLSKGMPDVKIAFMKICCGSTYLGNYTSKPNDCWIPPSSNNGTGGTHYKRMLTSIETALKAFGTAYDTALYTPRWAGFVWLQGEFDGQDQTLAKDYEKNLTNLINDVRKDLKTADMPIIIPMIDVQNAWPHNGLVRAAEVAVTKSLKNVDTMDTKGLPTDGTHYRAAGYTTIGLVCAERWLNMKYVYGEPVTRLVHNRGTAGETFRPATLDARVFDISGRVIGRYDFRASQFPAVTLNRRVSGFYIVGLNAQEGMTRLQVVAP